MNKEDAIYNLVETFRAIYREERDFTSDEMDIFDKYRALTKRLFLVRKSHNINVYDITKKQNWLEYKKPDKADLEKYKDYLIQINEIHKQRDKIEKAFIKNSEELLSQLLVFLIESIQRLSDTIIGPDILALIEVNREKQLRLFSNLPEEGFLQTSKYITDNIDKLANLMSSDEQIEKMVKTYNAEVTDGDNKLSFDLEFKKDGSTTDLDIYNQISQTLRIIKEPKHKLYYYALWNYAGSKGKGNRTFKGVKVSDIIKIAKPGKPVTYKDKLEFTEFLEAYKRVKIEEVEKVTVKKGKKTDTVETKVKFVSLFNVTDVTYTRKHDKQGNPINARTIRKIFGELPKDPYKTGIGYYIPETIFQLDGNQGERIAFFIELYRLKGQAYLFPEKPVSKKRFDLIRIAGLQETDKTNKTRANELLLETLKQGFELKLIKSYPAKLPVDDDEIIRIYLPYPKNNTTKLVKQYN